ncbi:MAG: hypothetical protein ACR2PG_09975 [Hyphomicrobiaceae bacterium]
MWSIFAGLVAGVIVAWFNYQYIWRSHLQAELQRSVFDDAMKALARYEVDVQDEDLQDLRPETKLARAKALAVVPGFFSKEAADAYKHVFDIEPQTSLRAKLDQSYFEKLETAVRLLAKELRNPAPSHFWDDITSSFKSGSKTST